MNRVGLLYHPDFLKHDTGPGHPERPERLASVMNHLLREPLWNQIAHLQAAPATVEQVALVHPENYISMIERRCKAGETILDQGDTHACRESYHVALMAAGAALVGVDQVLEDNLQSVFCAVRPPGHHAETATVMGFCLFNNIAIAARYAQREHGVGRVAILDWDVHHGNGTQEIFYEDPSVMYVSLHQYPYYPGTGAADETGKGKGEGFSVNCPMRAGSGEREYLEAFQSRIIPVLEKFRPELVLISAGFDAHKNDPLAQIELTEESFAKMTSLVMKIASDHCGGRIVSVLEGGYDLEALARSVSTHLRELIA